MFGALLANRSVFAGSGTRDVPVAYFRDELICLRGMSLEDPAVELNGVFILQGTLPVEATGFDPPPARKYRGNLRACILAYIRSLARIPPTGLGVYVWQQAADGHFEFLRSPAASSGEKSRLPWTSRARTPEVEDLGPVEPPKLA